ncbi:hypothetical protein J3R03_000858 [Actinoplanes couchii]|nr:hypothetical protein [Actinoplanes couchii]
MGSPSHRRFFPRNTEMPTTKTSDAYATLS